MEDKTYASRQIRGAMRSVDIQIDKELDSVLAPEYKAYVKGCTKKGKPVKTFAEWANS